MSPRENRDYAASAVLFVTGAVIGLVANAMHPHSAVSDRSDALRSIAESGSWVVIHLGIILAVMFVTGGLVGLVALLSDGAGRPLARLGLTAGVMGCAIVIVSTAVDGFAMKQLAAAWASSSDGQSGTALAVALGATDINFAIWTAGMLVFFGFTFICVGMAMVVSRTFPAYGWIAVASGAGSTFAALVQVVETGESPLAEAVFLGSSMLITFWSLSVGVLLWRYDER